MVLGECTLTHTTGDTWVTGGIGALGYFCLYSVATSTALGVLEENGGLDAAT